MTDIKKMVAEIRKGTIDSGAMEIAREVEFADINAKEANDIANAILGYEMDHEVLDSDLIEGTELYDLSAAISLLGEQYAPPTDILNAMGVSADKIDPADYEVSAEQRDLLARGWDVIDGAKGSKDLTEQQYALLLESMIAITLGKSRAEAA